MKRVVIHPEEPKTGKRYWRSLSEYARTPEFQEKLDREFLDGQAQLKDEGEAETSRRTFLKLMGASTAMGLAACRRPELYIQPYTKSPEWIIPGKPLYYATAMPRAGGATPLVVTTYEGRPTHLAGNPLHPESNGGLDVQAQASILGLYDPERAKGYLHKGAACTKADFDAGLEAFRAEVAKNGGKGLGILIDEVNSPTRDRLLGELKAKYAGAQVFVHEAAGNAQANAANQLAFGPGVVQIVHFDKADKVLALDCDFMGTDRLGNNSTSEFMKGRKAEKPGDPMNRLYVVEGRYSVTGGMADHRLRLAPSQIMKAAVELAKAIGGAAAAAAGGVQIKGEMGNKNASGWLEEAAKDLVASKGKAVVVVGRQQPKEVQLLVAVINQELGAIGTVVELKQGPASNAGSLADLAKKIEAKEITHLVLLGDTNPCYDAPSDLKFAEKFATLTGSLVLSTRHLTATARAATWAAPAAHYLESWSDVRGTDGTYSLVQPMILPLFQGISELDLLAALTADQAPPPAPATAAKPGEENAPGFDAVRATFNTISKAANQNDAWNIALRDGFVKDSAYPAATASLNAAVNAEIAKFADVEAPTKERIELNLVPCPKIHDGRYGNNPWLQEAPDPVTKVTWDNAAVMSVQTAKELGVPRKFWTISGNEGTAAQVSIAVGGVTKNLPVVVLPGHADYVITLALGYGQGDEGTPNFPGQVAQGAGVDVYPFRTTANLLYVPGATVKPIDETATLGLTQEHSAMYGRALVREGTIDDWKQNEEFVLEQGSDAHVHGSRAEKKAQNHYSFYKPEDRQGVQHTWDDLHQWGMVIDLNRCIGCSTCLVACQSENNIPVVGKDQVIRGREMHWIRMDRYFATDLDADINPESKFFGMGKDVWEEDFLDEPEMVVQPVACQHCESAPCETVCPVNATVHSPDGLNLMVYNRCIGTRYCANNCPFKARRFNFFDYNKRNPLIRTTTLGIEHNNLYSGPFGERHDTEFKKLQKNPNVSVRMRGVIEKCTYCLQRLESARIEARASARKQVAREKGVYDETLEIPKERLRIPTDGVKVACQQACPADAIEFGNLKDEKSTVNKWLGNSRNYEILSYLGVRARTTYLARIKNPNPALLERVKYEKQKAGNASKYNHGQMFHHEGEAH